MHRDIETRKSKSGICTHTKTLTELHITGTVSIYISFFDIYDYIFYDDTVCIHYECTSSHTS